jgi:hypothetical protein
MTKKLNNNVKAVSHKEFDQAIKALLNSPPRKKRREAK